MPAVLRRTGLGLLLALCVVISPSAAHTQAAARALVPTRWLAYGHDQQLTNFVDMPALSVNAARRLRLVWQKGLDGPIAASPLYDGHSVVVETEAGSVYALRPSDGATRWRRNFGVVETEDCGSWGFSSTGAIDLKHGILYAVGAEGLVHALKLSDGSELTGWPLAITDEDDEEYVWGGLRLLNGLLYVPIASYCDAPNEEGDLANGRLIAIDVAKRKTVATFDPVPGDGNLGGVWGWGGVSVEPGGKALYTGVGNSHVYDEACDCYIDTAGYGDSMVRLTPGLRPVASNRPKGISSTGDLDMGSAPLLFRPPGCPPLAAANVKNGFLYVWNRDHIGRGPRFSSAVGDGPASFVGQPAYSARLHSIFDSEALVMHSGRKVGNGVLAFSIDARCHFHRRWLTSVGVGQEPPPLVIGDVVFAPGGDRGGFSALDARTGKYLWRTATVDATISPPIAAGGLILAGDYGGTLRAFAAPGTRRR